MPDLTTIAPFAAASFDRSFVRRLEASRSDHMDEAMPGRNRGVGGGHLGDGEFDDAVRRASKRRDIARHFHAIGRQASQHAEVHADHLGGRRINRADDGYASGFSNRAHQSPAHPATGASNNQTHIGHHSLSV